MQFWQVWGESDGYEQLTPIPVTGIMKQKGADMVFKFKTIIPTPKLSELIFTEELGPSLLEWIGHMVETNLDQFVTPDHFQVLTKREAADRLGSIDSQGFVYIKQAVLIKMLADQGMSAKLFLKWANRKGYLKTEAGRYTISRRFPHDKIHRCACFQLEENE